MGYRCLCHRCKKVFYWGDLTDYAYKMDGYYFCSWSCLRKYEKQKEQEQREKRRELQKQYGKKKNVHS